MLWCEVAESSMFPTRAKVMYHMYVTENVFFLLTESVLYLPKALNGDQMWQNGVLIMTPLSCSGLWKHP